MKTVKKVQYLNNIVVEITDYLVKRLQTNNAFSKLDLLEYLKTTQSHYIDLLTIIEKSGNLSEKSQSEKKKYSFYQIVYSFFVLYR